MAGRVPRAAGNSQRARGAKVKRVRARAFRAGEVRLGIRRGADPAASRGAVGEDARRFAMRSAARAGQFARASASGGQPTRGNRDAQCRASRRAR
ncbi:MAG TPA: hypothetical protein VGU27_00415, partial [Candidatus Eisenbacteria bacterium]|nr:hypothetical protein [Candidatus Eisenbacteria bacterium]